MPPINILIKPASSLCNMRCKYCFYADVSDNRQVKSYGIMSEDTLDNLVRKVFLEAEGFASFSCQGGEPTLAGLDFYKTVLKLQRKYNTKNLPVHNAIQTNGYCIDEEWADFWAENHFLVGLSMDGTKEIHDQMRIDASGEGTFDRVQKATEILDKYHAEYNILCVVNDLTARYPKRVYNYLKKYKFLQFIPCLDPFDNQNTEYSLTPERYFRFLSITFNAYYEDFLSGNYVSVRNFDNYINILLGRPPENCAMRGVCTCYLVVEGDGSVYPCDFYVLDEWKLGNINTDSLATMINSQTAKHFVQISTVQNEKCGHCRYYALCRGGCRRDREPIHDDTPGLNRMCAAYISFFDNNYMKMQDIASKIRHSV